MTRFLLAVFTALALFGISAATTRAGDDCCTYKKVTCYETVVCYEIQKEPYTKIITLYDKCGHPYKVTKTCYREVEVAVKKLVPVTKWVKVCY